MQLLRSAGHGVAFVAGWFVSVFPVLLGLVLVSVGAWMAWRPAGLIVPGVALLADEVWDRVSG